jgi:hypothetical protein
MGDWMRSPVTGDLSQVPGIGPASIKKLSEVEDEPITNTYMLIGKFLMLKGPDEGDRKVGTVEHADRFWFFLQEAGITAHRSAIVKAVAEKVNAFIPGVYEAEEFENSEDEDDEKDE